jgi:hypothetical protein
MTVRTRSARLAALAAACALTVPPLAAQTSAPALARRPAAATSAPPTSADASARESAVTKGNARGALLTRDELRRCMAEQDRLAAETDAVLQVQQGLERERAEIVRLGVELKAKLDTIDRSRTADVEAYNALAEARNARIADYDAAMVKTNERVAVLEPARLAWSRDCAERRFREEDRAAIKAGR